MNKLEPFTLTKPYFFIRLGKNLIFIWTSTPDNPSKGSIDLKIRNIMPELLWLSKSMGCRVENDKIIVPNLDIYYRLLVYACIRLSLRDRMKIRELTTLVFEMSSLDANYWASRFRELWWKHKKYRSLLNTIKAFKLFFGLG